MRGERARVEQRARLAAAAADRELRHDAVRVVRTDEDAGHGNAAGREAPDDLRVHGVDLSARQDSPREAGLVRYDEEERPVVRERLQAARGAGREAHAPRIPEEAALDDERPVAVDEERVPARTPAGPRASQDPPARAFFTASSNDASDCGPASFATSAPVRE